MDDEVLLRMVRDHLQAAGVKDLRLRYMLNSCYLTTDHDGHISEVTVKNAVVKIRNQIKTVKYDYGEWSWAVAKFDLSDPQSFDQITTRVKCPTVVVVSPDDL
jgi:hypothetical protein